MGRRSKTPEEKLRELLFADATEKQNEELDRLKEEYDNRQLLDEQALEAEAVLLFFDLKGKGFEQQECPQCHRTFAYKYTLAVVDTKKLKQGKVDEVVAYKKYTGSFRCSNECRIAGLKERGIEWRPGRLPEERWGMSEQTKGVMPLIVPPDALEILNTKINRQPAEHSETP
jgi:hypothetical protein